jgi:fucose 4-O-acetylase-like acetyltransferase
MALTAGLFDTISKPWSLSRSLVFLPFFVGGVLYGWRVIDWTTARATPRMTAASLLVVLGVGASLSFAGVSHLWYFGAASYTELYTPGLDGLLRRAVLFTLSVAVTVAFLILVPDRPGRLERVGRRSLAIYLFHMFGVLAAAGAVAAVDDWLGSVGATLLSVIPAIAITVLFAVPIFDRAVRSVLAAFTRKPATTSSSS